MIQLQPINRGHEMQDFTFISMAFGSGGIVLRSESTCHMSVTVLDAMQRDGRVTRGACFLQRRTGDGGIAAAGDLTSGSL